ncbi:MAG: hypothetical protein NTW19_08570 [Planctomycetota bacterium]|nr:hypothetical protein [Planctomycetota bacterium]
MLHEFEPKWVRSVGNGFTMLAMAIGVGMLSGVLPVFLGDDLDSHLLGFCILVGMTVSFFGLTFLGAWSLGTRSPDEPKGLVRWAARVGSRWSLMLCVAAVVVPLALRSVWRSGQWSMLGFYAFGGVGLVAVFLRAAFLARLVPSRSIARQALALGLLFALHGGFMVLFYLAITPLGGDMVNALVGWTEAVYGRRPPLATKLLHLWREFIGAWQTFVPYIEWISWVLFIWAAAVLWWCSRRFREAERMARKMKAAGEAAGG